MSARFDNREVAVALAAGLVFGAGLVISSMTDPRLVIGFLDLTGVWNPTLGLVLVGATGTHLLSRPLLKRLAPHAVAAGTPSNRAIDKPLLMGAALFGAGWGIAGYCPGPAFTAVLPALGTTLGFTAAMIGGMAAYQALHGEPSLKEPRDEAC